LWGANSVIPAKAELEVSKANVLLSGEPDAETPRADNIDRSIADAAGTRLRVDSCRSIARTYRPTRTASGGLRGGISVALALALPPGPESNVLRAMTYSIVVFSVPVQGMTIRAVTRAIADCAPENSSSH